MSLFDLKCLFLNWLFRWVSLFVSFSCTLFLQVSLFVFAVCDLQRLYMCICFALFVDVSGALGRSHCYTNYVNKKLCLESFRSIALLQNICKQETVSRVFQADRVATTIM